MIGGDLSSFIIGTLIGIALFVIGWLVGRWWERRCRRATARRENLLELAQELAQWTSDVSGDVSKYQSELSELIEQIAADNELQPGKVQELLSRMSRINRDLQLRIQQAEKRLERQTEQLEEFAAASRTDDLTGLENRRAFDEQLEANFQRWLRLHQLFTVVLIDIDYFKRINDRYGHLAGDEVLRSVARTLNTCLENAQCVARYGGEEFGVLTINGMEKTAQEIEAVRRRIEAEHFEFEGQVIPVTISAGVASVQAGDSAADVVRRADEALYASKLGGRNRVSVHDGVLCHPVGESCRDPEKTECDGVADTEDSEELRAKVEQRLRAVVLDETKRLGG